VLHFLIFLAISQNVQKIRNLSRKYFNETLLTEIEFNRFV
jgi:hypothetical protein